MEQYDLTTEEYIDISERIRSGEYFREARSMVDTEIHQPMTERYIFLILSIISIIITIMSFSALSSLYPLKPKVPFIFGIHDVYEDQPKIHSLSAYTGEDANASIRRFLISNYVEERESYDVDTFDRNVSALKQLSTEQAFNEYYKSISASNPNSPVSLYGRKIERSISIISVDASEKTIINQIVDRGYKARVIFEATLKNGETKNPPTRWQVDVAFQYESIKLDEETLKIEPYGFIVTGYSAKQL